MAVSTLAREKMETTLANVIAQVGYKGAVRIALISLSGEPNDATEPFLIFPAPRTNSERKLQTIVEETFNLHRF